MTESELYKSLSRLTKEKERWKENIPTVASLLKSESVKLKAKALWLLGEMGLVYPQTVNDFVPSIAIYRNSEDALLRERAINAIGRIGRGCYELIAPYWTDLFRMVNDDSASVRLAFIWASENIATYSPELYVDHMSVYAELLRDQDDRVRMEAPEMFRVMGKRIPESVKPYICLLQQISETDSNRVVRIHCQGAIRAVGINERPC